MATTAVSITHRLNQIVEAAGGQRPLGRMIDVDPSTVNNWLKGSAPRRAQLRKICEKTGISEDWLVNGRGSVYAELAKVKSIAMELAEDSARVREVAPPFPTPIMISTVGDDGGAGEASPGKKKARMPFTDATLMRMISEILDSEAMDPGERIKTAKPYQQELQRRMSALEQ